MTKKSNNEIEIIAYIKSQIGVALELDKDFPGIRNHKEQRYFNVDLKERTTVSTTYTKLLNICGPNSIIKHVEANGSSRVAIFF